MSLITFTDKQAMGTQPSIPEVNKITDSNINEIKNVVNTNFELCDLKGNTVSKDFSVVSGSLSTNSWVNCASNLNVEVEKGEYLILTSVTLNGLGTGIATTNLTINGNRESYFSRSTVPLLNGLGSTANDIYYRVVSSTQTITFNIQAYVSAGCNVAIASMYLVRIK